MQTIALAILRFFVFIAFSLGVHVYETLISGVRFEVTMPMRRAETL
jgi:hypothetical protein